MAAGNLLSAGHVAGSGQEALHPSRTAKVCDHKANAYLFMASWDGFIVRNVRIPILPYHMFMNFRFSLSKLSVFASSSLQKYI